MVAIKILNASIKGVTNINERALEARAKQPNNV